MNKLIEADYAVYQAQILHVRAAVFIVEQGVPAELEVDEQDPLCRHLLWLVEGQPVATGRLTPDGHIGRLAVLKPFRHRGYASQLIASLERIAANQGFIEIKLAAQTEVVSFYEKRGYQVYGDVFMDAGISHRMMNKVLIKNAGTT